MFCNLSYSIVKHFKKNFIMKANFDSVFLLTKFSINPQLFLNLQQKWLYNFHGKKYFIEHIDCEKKLFSNLFRLILDNFSITSFSLH